MKTVTAIKIFLGLDSFADRAKFENEENNCTGLIIL